MKEKTKSQIFEDYWDNKKIRRILSNRIYTGDMVQGITSKYNYKTKKRYVLPDKDWIVVPNTHEAIICKEKFDVVQIQIKKGSCPKSEDTEPSILTGYLKCADCGKKMVRTSAAVNGSTYRRFICSTYKKLGKDACASHIIGEDVLLEIILTTIQSQIKSAVKVESVIKKTQSEILKAKERLFYSNKIKHIEDELDKIGDLKRGLYEDYKEGIITLDEYNIMKPEYEKAYLKKQSELRT